VNESFAAAPFGYDTYFNDRIVASRAIQQVRLQAVDR